MTRATTIYPLGIVFEPQPPTGTTSTWLDIDVHLSRKRGLVLTPAKRGTAPGSEARAKRAKNMSYLCSFPSGTWTLLCYASQLLGESPAGCSFTASYNELRETLLAWATPVAPSRLPRGSPENGGQPEHERTGSQAHASLAPPRAVTGQRATSGRSRTRVVLHPRSVRNATSKHQKRCFAAHSVILRAFSAPAVSALELVFLPPVAQLLLPASGLRASAALLPLLYTEASQRYTRSLNLRRAFPMNLSLGHVGVVKLHFDDLRPSSIPSKTPSSPFSSPAIPPPRFCRLGSWSPEITFHEAPGLLPSASVCIQSWTEVSTARRPCTWWSRGTPGTPRLVFPPYLRHCSTVHHRSHFLLARLPSLIGDELFD